MTPHVSRVSLHQYHMTAANIHMLSLPLSNRFYSTCRIVVYSLGPTLHVLSISTVIGQQSLQYMADNIVLSRTVPARVKHQYSHRTAANIHMLSLQYII